MVCAIDSRIRSQSCDSASTRRSKSSEEVARNDLMDQFTASVTQTGDRIPIEALPDHYTSTNFIRGVTCVNRHR